MIPKEEREKDKAVLAAATPDWQQGHHVDEPKALCSAQSPDDSLLMLDKDGMAIFWKEADAAAAVTGRNRLPLYIAELDAIEEEIARYIEDVRGVIAEKRDPGAVETHLDYQHGQIAALDIVLGILRKPGKKRRAK